MSVHLCFNPTMYDLRYQDESMVKMLEGMFYFGHLDLE